MIVDNTPTVILIPAGIFDFLQDIDDYYFPVMIGNYFEGAQDNQHDRHPVRDAGISAVRRGNDTHLRGTAVLHHRGGDSP